MTLLAGIKSFAATLWLVPAHMHTLLFLCAHVLQMAHVLSCCWHLSSAALLVEPESSQLNVWLKHCASCNTKLLLSNAAAPDSCSEGLLTMLRAVAARARTMRLPEIIKDGGLLIDDTNFVQHRVFNVQQLQEHSIQSIRRC